MRTYANIGGPIALFVLGAIMYFALNASVVAGVNLAMIGLILMVAAVVWLVLGLVFKSRSTSGTAVVREDRIERP